MKEPDSSPALSSEPPDGVSSEGPDTAEEVRMSTELPSEEEELPIEEEYGPLVLVVELYEIDKAPVPGMRMRTRRRIAAIMR